MPIMTKRELLIEAMIQLIRTEVHGVPDSVMDEDFFISINDSPDTVRAEYWIEGDVVYKNSSGREGEEVYRLD